MHYTTTPSIEVAADGKTARGLWIAAGVESGLSDPEQVAGAPAFLYEKDQACVWRIENQAAMGS